MPSTPPAASACEVGAAPSALTLRVVVMGVSGCGKSTVGQLLAQHLDCAYLEGDELHPPANVAKMGAGTPLTDADREGWLAAIARHLATAQAQGQGLVVGCSALKRAYRQQLRTACPGLRLVHLHGERALLQTRLQARTGHYMPASLLDSQLATLEWPDADETAIALDIRASVTQLASQALARLQAAPPNAQRPT